MTRKERLTSMLQDVALVMGLYLALVFANANLEWYHWAIIMTVVIIMGIKSTINGIKSGVEYSIGHIAHEPEHVRQALYKEHLDHCPGVKKED